MRKSIFFYIYKKGAREGGRQAGMLLPPLAQKLGQMVLKWSEMESRLEDEQNGGSWRSVGRFQKFYKNLDEWCRENGSLTIVSEP